MSFLELAHKRFSVRSYDSRPVDAELVIQVLEAARWAPSACNLQPWRWVVVTEQERRTALRPAYDREWVWNAPVVLAACLDTTECWKRQADGKSYGDVDIAIAFDHLTLAAADLGLGTCWIGAFNPSIAREALGLPAHIEPIALTPLGYPLAGAQPRNPKRKELAEIVHWERWQ